MGLIFLWHISLPACQWKIQPFSDNGIHAVAVKCRQEPSRWMHSVWFVSQEQTAAFSVAGWSWVSNTPGFMGETVLIYKLDP